LIVKEVNKFPYQNLYFTSLTYKSPRPVFDAKEFESPDTDFPQYAGCGIVLITGIANPFPLKEYLRQTAGEITHLSFPDHYNYKENDIVSISKAFMDLKPKVKYLFTTEKDAVRLREFTNIAEPIRSAFFYIPIGINFLNDDKEEFDNLIIEYVRKNKGNN
jgi:tetraacyldisaccharide 4'-kinase